MLSLLRKMCKILNRERVFQFMMNLYPNSTSNINSSLLSNEATCYVRFFGHLGQD